MAQGTVPAPSPPGLLFLGYSVSAVDGLVGAQSLRTGSIPHRTGPLRASGLCPSSSPTSGLHTWTQGPTQCSGWGTSALGSEASLGPRSLKARPRWPDTVGPGSWSLHSGPQVRPRSLSAPWWSVVHSGGHGDPTFPPSCPLVTKLWGGSLPSQGTGKTQPPPASQV